MVDPDVQGQGLSWVLYGLTTLVLFARDGFRPKWISNVTQVPAVFGMVCDTFSDVYPSADASARQSFAHLQLARGIMRAASRGVRRRRRGRLRRGALRHHRRLYRRIGRAEENLRRRAKASRRAIQRVLPARTRLRQGRRRAAARPRRSRRRAALSAARGAGRLDAGAAGGLRRAGAATAGAAVDALDGRYARVRHLAAAEGAADEPDVIRRDRRFHRQSLRRARALRRDVRAVPARSQKPADPAPALAARRGRAVVLRARRRVVDRQRACSTGSR